MRYIVCMAQLSTKTYPDPFLRKAAEEVLKIDGTVKSLIRDMFDTMDEADGVGLAAPQVGVSRRIIVFSLNEKGFERMALINPVIERVSAEKDTVEEGCLSVPGIRADVERSVSVIARGVTRSGKMVEINARDILARVLQHEIDHLNGTLFIDRLGIQERERVEPELINLVQKQGVYAVSLEPRESARITPL